MALGAQGIQEPLMALGALGPKEVLEPVEAMGAPPGLDDGLARNGAEVCWREPDGLQGEGSNPDSGASCPAFPLQGQGLEVRSQHQRRSNGSWHRCRDVRRRRSRRRSDQRLEAVV